MTALNIRDLGDERKVTLAAEAKVRAERELWAMEAREGLAYEADYLAVHGPSLTRYRRAQAGVDWA